MKARAKEVIEMFYEKIVSSSKETDEIILSSIDKIIKELEILIVLKLIKILIYIDR